MSFKEFYISEGINDRGIFKAIFMCGFPGAGKSYTASKITSGNIQPRVVNTDRIIEYFGKIGKVELSGTPIERAILDKSLNLTKAALYNYLNGILPLLIDSTSSNSSNIMLRFGALESLGYDLGMVFVNTDLDVAIERVRKRERKVPVDFIKKVYEKTKTVKPYYKSKFPFFIEIDNNEGELTEEVILKAFKKVLNFYSETIKNPLGVEIVEKMKKDKEKYLIPNIKSKQEINKVVSLWYRRA